VSQSELRGGDKVLVLAADPHRQRGLTEALHDIPGTGDVPAARNGGDGYPRVRLRCRLTPGCERHLGTQVDRREASPSSGDSESHQSDLVIDPRRGANQYRTPGLSPSDGFVVRGEAAHDHVGNEVLRRDRHRALRPLKTDPVQGRHEPAIHHRLESAVGEAFLDHSRDTRGVEGSGCDEEFSMGIDAAVVAVGVASDLDGSGPRRPAGLHQFVHRRDPREGLFVVVPVAGSRSGRRKQAVASFPGAQRVFGHPRQL